MTVSKSLTALVRVSSTVEPETATSVTGLAIPAQLTANVGAAAVAEERASS